MSSTLVISISSHGIIPTIKNDIGSFIPKTRKLTEDVNIFKINAIDIGIPNVSNAPLTEKMILKFRKIANKKTVKTTINIVEELKKTMISITKELEKQLINDSKYLEPLRKYVHRMHSRFQIEYIKKNTEYIDKIYQPFIDTELENYADGIHFLNHHDINLFELIEAATGNKITHISLSELIDFVTNFTQIENIILIDLSCSTMDIDARSTRRLRREWNTLHYTNVTNNI